MPMGGASSAEPVKLVMAASVESPGSRAASPSRHTAWNQVEERVAP